MFQKSFVFKWDGQAATSWTRLEELQTELPRDTIVEAEVVQEMRGQVRVAGVRVKVIEVTVRVSLTMCLCLSPNVYSIYA